MLDNAADDPRNERLYPGHVRNRLEPGERPRAVLVGGNDAGFVLTDRRLIAWRGHGSSVPLQVADVDRVQLDVREERVSILLVVSRDPEAPALMLGLNPANVAAARRFMEDVIDVRLALAAADYVERSQWRTMTVLQFRES